MNKPVLRALVAGSLFFGASAAYADDDQLFDDRFYIAPVGSLTGNHNDSTSTDGLGGGLAIGKPLMPHLGVELLGDYLHYRGKSTTTTTTGLVCGLLSSCTDVSKAPNHTFYGGGLGVNAYASKMFSEGVFLHADAQGGDRFMFNVGLGFDQPFANKSVYLRAELLYHKEAGFPAGPLFHLGARIPFGTITHPAAEQPSEPVAVVPPVDQPPPAPEGGESAAPAAPPAPEAAPAAQPAPAPVPAKKHSTKGKRHKKTAPADSSQSNAAPAQPEPASEPAPAPAQEPQESVTTSSEPAAPPTVPQPAPSAGSSPSDDSQAPTEPAPAPPH